MISYIHWCDATKNQIINNYAYIGNEGLSIPIFGGIEASRVIFSLSLCANGINACENRFNDETPIIGYRPVK